MPSPRNNPSLAAALRLQAARLLANARREADALLAAADELDAEGAGTEDPRREGGEAASVLMLAAPDVWILQVLARAHRYLDHAEIATEIGLMGEAARDRKVTLSLKSTATRLKTLRNDGLVARPPGRSTRDGITPAGRDALAAAGKLPADCR